MYQQQFTNLLLRTTIPVGVLIVISFQLWCFFGCHLGDTQLGCNFRKSGSKTGGRRGIECERRVSEERILKRGAGEIEQIRIQTHITLPLVWLKVNAVSF